MLVKMVRLLYSGKMSGEGEKEKQEAISAAASLGIHGLVEVTKRDCKSRNGKGDCQHTEVGVQTQPLLEESEARQDKWRREMRDGSTILWKEMLSNGKKDSCTQTEELQVNTASSYRPAPSFETTDMTALQRLGQTDSYLVVPQIPYVPISLVYPPDANQTPQPSSAPAASFQESPAAGDAPVAVVAPPYSSVPPSLLPFSSQTTLLAADPHSWWAGPEGAGRDVAAGKEEEDKQLKQFQDNIPGFISYFLNQDKVEGPCRRRPQKQQGAGVGGARRAGTGERRARRPQARTGGRGRGGLTQKVDVQDVGVSRLQKLFLKRQGMQVCRMGQGGGAVGRKLYLKTRELLKPTRRRGRGKAWDFSQSGELPPYSEMGGGGNMQRRRRTTVQEFKQDGVPVGRPQRATDKSATSVSFSSTPMQFNNIHTLPAPSPFLQPNLMSPAASYTSPASSLLHTDSLPPPSSPPHEDQPEHLDRLLEEVIMGFDYSSSVNTFSQNKQQSHITGLLDAGPGFHGSADVAGARGAGRSSSANGEVPILQQKGEGELTEMLDHFLQSFEQHVDSYTAREEEETAGEDTTEASQPYTVLGKYSRTKIQITAPHTPHPQRTHTAGPAQTSHPITRPDETPQSCSQPDKASSCSTAPPKHTEGTPGTVGAKRSKRRKTKQYLFTLEKQRKKKPASLSDVKTKIIHDHGSTQLKQIPVVQLKLLPVKVTLQRHSCRLEVKSPAKTKTSSSSSSLVKSPSDSLSEENQLVSWRKTTYPIRSRLKEAHMDSTDFLEQPLPDKRTRSARQPGRRQAGPKKGLSNDESPTSPIQLQPVETCGRDEQLESNQDRHEEELTVLPQEEATGLAERGMKRGAEEERSDDTNVTKRGCFEQMTQPTSEMCLPSSESTDPVSEAAAVEPEDVIDVETFSLTSEQEEKIGGSVLKLEEADQNGEEWESLTDDEMEIIDVEGDSDGSTGLEREDECREWADKIRCQNRTAPELLQFVKVKPPVSLPSLSLKEVSLGPTGSCGKRTEMETLM